MSCVRGTPSCIEMMWPEPHERRFYCQYCFEASALKDGTDPLVTGMSSKDEHSVPAESRKPRQPHPDEAEAVRVEVHNGTPYLYYPDGDEHGGAGESRREATVAEWRFWQDRAALVADRERLKNENERLHQAVDRLLPAAEAEVARKDNSRDGGAEYWAHQPINDFAQAPGVARRINLARAVLFARAAVLSRVSPPAGLPEEEVE